MLDTNVLSALMRRDSQAVGDWLDAQPTESIWTTAITMFEIRFGIEVLAGGRRRKELEGAFDKVIDKDLDGRILSFDQTAAHAAASIAANQRRAGRPVEIRDIQIAGICAARRAMLATRNTRHFEGAGIALINPWSN